MLDSDWMPAGGFFYNTFIWKGMYQRTYCTHKAVSYFKVTGTLLKVASYLSPATGTVGTVPVIKEASVPRIRSLRDSDPWQIVTDPDPSRFSALSTVTVLFYTAWEL
jgi:hypothetical protein